jgi:hypothetical protein
MPAPSLRLGAALSLWHSRRRERESTAAAFDIGGQMTPFRLASTSRRIPQHIHRITGKRSLITMKKSSLFASLFVGLLIATGGLLAADAKEVTVTGEGACAKCSMHETEDCQTAITTTENGQKVVYYLADNAVSENFHKNVCKAPAKVTATGTVEMKDGKNILTASKIEVAQ